MLPSDYPKHPLNNSDQDYDVTITRCWFQIVFIPLKTRPKIIQFDDQIFLLNGWLHHQLDYISELELHFQILWSLMHQISKHTAFFGGQKTEMMKKYRGRCFKYILVFLSSFTSTRQTKHLPMSPCVFLG